MTKWDCFYWDVTGSCCQSQGKFKQGWFFEARLSESFPISHTSCSPTSWQVLYLLMTDLGVKLGLKLSILVQSGDCKDAQRLSTQIASPCPRNFFPQASRGSGKSFPCGNSCAPLRQYSFRKQIKLFFFLFHKENIISLQVESDKSINSSPVLWWYNPNYIMGFNSSALLATLCGNNCLISL